MARSKSPTLTDAELRLMRVLWRRGPSTVAEVTDALKGDDKVAYSTVQTTMRILEEKGYLTHHKEGRAFVYSAQVGAGQARQSALRYVLDRFFNNSPELLLMNVIESEEIDLENAEQIRDLLRASGLDEEVSS
ncbi:MAG: BlaI/MecI/CopY family transcriptional regulator [Rhodothermales bacterium]|nr:BlaI/MecI/CopY family transcriptional regulator [Rhodothermales bacterium]MBO6779256.1 BlaI/MecI/CopY family transcriptional regulator [Rhodothermales bacterium]